MTHVEIVVCILAIYALIVGLLMVGMGMVYIPMRSNNKLIVCGVLMMVMLKLMILLGLVMGRLLQVILTVAVVLLPMVHNLWIERQVMRG